MPPVLTDAYGVPLPRWMQEHLAHAAAAVRDADPSASWQRLVTREEPPPLAWKLCAACETEFAVEGDAGDGREGVAWFCSRCRVPDRDYMGRPTAYWTDAFIRAASDRHHRRPLWYRRAFCWYCRGRLFGGPVYAQLAERWEASGPGLDAAA